jgi:hypothetical protein
MSISNRMLFAAVLVGSLAVPYAFTAMPAAAKPASPVKTYDTDNDKTLDIAEVKAAAGAAFDKLEKDNDGTVDRKEIGRRLSTKEFAAADPDHDKTLTKEEYLAVVEKLFKAADTDNDGTLSAKELHSKSGRALLRLMQ